jgi:hypothetical protein
MDARTFSARLSEYASTNAMEQELALQEMLQGVVLAALSRAGFFKIALFHGGTCLRLVHGLNRFSEDLDFLLKGADPVFHWAPYLDAIRQDCAASGIVLETRDKSAAGTAVQKAWLKTDSIGTILEFNPPFPRMAGRKIRIKLEVDTRPPEGSGYETHYVTFPETAPITVQDLPSAFATKLHALLCRTYTKGRDWYDFLWFTARRISPRLDVLENAIEQQGPWAGQRLRLTPAWLHHALEEAISVLDWPRAVSDVQRFLPVQEQAGLRLWNADLFLYQARRLAEYMRPDPRMPAS